MRSVLLVAMLLLGCTRIDGPQPSPSDVDPDHVTPINVPPPKETALASAAMKAYAAKLATDYESLATIQESANPLTPKQVHDQLAALGEAARKSGWKGVADDDAVVFADKYDPKLHAARLRKMAAGIRSAVKK